MLNSCVTCLSAPKPRLHLRTRADLRVAQGIFPYLLDSHHNLDGVQAVQAQVVGEVCGGLDLQVTQMMSVAKLPTAGGLDQKQALFAGGHIRC